MYRPLSRDVTHDELRINLAAMLEGKQKRTKKVFEKNTLIILNIIANIEW